MSRTKKSIRNVIFTIVGFVVTTLLQLVNRKVFILFLSSEYLGLNGLFSNILSMLSLSEMGIGAAIVFALYKPIAEKNTEKVKSLMALYKKAIYDYRNFCINCRSIAHTFFTSFD